MNAVNVMAQGKTLRPSVNVINTAVGPVYGTINLLVDSRIVYSESGVFEPGTTIKDLEWQVPKSQAHVKYDIQASLETYGLIYLSDRSIFNSFAKTQTVPLSEQIPILAVTDEWGNVVARPTSLYSSNTLDENSRFQVTAPNGECVIGSGSDCLVNESTKSYRGGLQRVVVDGQTLSIRYSGPDNPMERFSITSSGPIVGNWNINLESAGMFGQTASAQTELWLKVKYRAEYNLSVIVSSE